MYFGLIGLLAEPGVLAAMVDARAVVLVALVGPASALVSLQLALLVSSRANDARTAQQFGVLIILPMTGLLVAQFSGRGVADGRHVVDHRRSGSWRCGRCWRS